jgi:hypothetical protein
LLSGGCSCGEQYLEAYIHNFLDQEFYTVAEDGSVEEVRFPPRHTDCDPI